MSRKQTRARARAKSSLPIIQDIGKIKLKVMPKVGYSLSLKLVFHTDPPGYDKLLEYITTVQSVEGDKIVFLSPFKGRHYMAKVVIEA